MQTSWLDPDEQQELVEGLLRYGLLKFSNKRDLPLKSGGKTDVYINLRDARNDPGAITFISGFFANALRRLDIHRFVEVPDSVSCFAGPISQSTGLPYLTIRESPKEGRVAKARVIGAASYGDPVAIIDDVVTDGASKVQPIEECVRMGLNVRSLVVLVDRQQGWQEKFQRLGIAVPVWAGMTLHDVRRHLVSTGRMERCDPALEEKNPIIVALDDRNWEEVLAIVDPLRTSGCILKVNDLLLARGSDWLLPNLSVYGRIMLDPNTHDISNTAENIARRFTKCPPWAMTVHASGGQKMVEKAVEGLKGVATKVLAVTVLTSFDEATCTTIYHRTPSEQVVELAVIAHLAGAHGFVCATDDVPRLRRTYPDKILVVPGIRSEGAAVGDQNRTGTPAGAIENGANHIVMGRQILGAKDPVAEVMRVLGDELQRL